MTRPHDVISMNDSQGVHSLENPSPFYNCFLIVSCLTTRGYPDSMQIWLSDHRCERLTRPSGEKTCGPRIHMRRNRKSTGSRHLLHNSCVRFTYSTISTPWFGATLSNCSIDLIKWCPSFKYDKDMNSF